MISDSVPWKQELWKAAERIARRSVQRRWTERTAFLVEREVMVGCFAIRKLLDTPAKMSDEFRSYAVRVIERPLNASAPDFWTAYKPWAMYDLASDGAEIQLLPRDLCNRVIHSLVWTLNVDEAGTGIESFFVASDRSSLAALTEVPIARLVDLFRKAALDEVVSTRMKRDDAGRMTVVYASSQLRH